MTESSLAFYLAGGKGERLMPLTLARAKPAMPFSRYRMIDFNVSQVIHAGVQKHLFLTMRSPRALDIHTDVAYDSYRVEGSTFRAVYPTKIVASLDGEDIEPYAGTADAVFQKMVEFKVYNNRPEHVLVFAGDHITDINVKDMMMMHHKEPRDLTIAAEVRRVCDEDFEIREGVEYYKFGRLVTDRLDRVVDFKEKLPRSEMPENGKTVLVSMGNYIFHRDPLVWALEQGFGVDFGKHVIPGMMANGRDVYAYRFKGSPDIKGDIPLVYWRDVGSLDSYFDACMELNDEDPKLNLKKLIKDKRPVITFGGNFAPIRSNGVRKISTIAEGCENYGILENCVLSQDVIVGKGSSLINTVVFPDVKIAPGCKITNTIIDKHNRIPAGTHIGYDRNEDKEKGYFVFERDDGSYMAVVPRVEPVIE